MAIDFDAINRRALSRLPDLLRRWLPGGDVRGHEYVVKNPLRYDHKPGSFSINTITGRWADFVPGGPSGGDSISLYAYLKGLENGQAAIGLAAELGIDVSDKPNGKWTKHEWHAIPVPSNVKLLDGGKWPEGTPFPTHPELGTPSSVVWFHNQAGEVIVGECRFDITKADGTPGKEYRPLTYCRRDDGARFDWRWKGPQRPYPLFDLPALITDPSKPIIITEGARKAEIARELFPDCAATACLFGAKSPECSNWAPLFGRDCIIWPDNDTAGVDFANKVAALCIKAGAKSVSIVKIPDSWPRKWDLRDPPPEGVTDETLIEMLQSAQPWSPSEAPNTDPRPIDLSLLSGSDWLMRDIPEPDFMLGELLSTTCRVELIGPTGLGKTNVLVALSMAVADGRDFLHWRGAGSPRRVLYIDGEMSRRLAKKRLVDAARRHGRMPETFHYLNREDFSELEPLNTADGQSFVDAVVEALGGVDLIVLDNVQALLSGDMKDEEPWQKTLPWVRSLTSRSIGQIWTHHTGHDVSHGYGSKTREWQLDTVILMEAVERPETDIAFSIAFTKARERSPDNRADFDQAIITLANDAWTSELGGHVRTKRAAKDRALELLQEAIAREGAIPPACAHIPPNKLCVTEGMWRRYCELGCISEGTPDATRKAFQRAADKLIKAGLVGKWELWVWVV